MIDRDLLEILACPDNKTPVRLADDEEIARVNARIDAGSMKNRGGVPVAERIEAGLVREDGRYLYPIRDDIPIMLIDEALPLAD